VRIEGAARRAVAAQEIVTTSSICSTTSRVAIATLVSASVWVCAGAGGAASQTAPRRPARTPDIFFAPTWEPVAYEMLKLAGVTADDVIYDLGSGDGRIVILAAQKYGARGVGIEIDPHLVEISRQVARDAELAHRVTFVEGDLFTADISQATVVTLYLSPSVNRALESKLRQELRPGTRIVSHQFRIGDWTPDRVVRAEGDGTDLFLWTIPRR
jgi:SAM-dependent methyltransferase